MISDFGGPGEDGKSGILGILEIFSNFSRSLNFGNAKSEREI